MGRIACYESLALDFGWEGLSAKFHSEVIAQTILANQPPSGARWQGARREAHEGEAHGEGAEERWMVFHGQVFWGVRMA